MLELYNLERVLPADLRSVIFALVVDRKELDHCDELKQFFAQSVRPEPEAILPIVANEPIKRPKKSKVRVVDLDTEATEALESLKSIAISISLFSIFLPPSTLPCVRCTRDCNQGDTLYEGEIEHRLG